MRIFDIPNYGKIKIENVIFDVNGTIQFDGIVPTKLRKKIKKLKSYFNIFLISGYSRKS